MLNRYIYNRIYTSLLPGVSRYSDYTIALKLQAGQGYWVGRVAGWAELRAGQNCGLDRVDM